MKKLLDIGVSPNGKQNNFDTPLTTALGNDMQEMVSFLLSRGADPNLDGESLPIAIAAGKAEPTMLQMLIEAGADVNKLYEGDFALRAACRHNRIENVKLLIRHGANINMTNESGESAIDMTANQRHDDLLTMLLDGGPGE